MELRQIPAKADATDIIPIVAAPDIVIWPENSSDLDPFAEPVAALEITRAEQAIGKPILVGAVLNGTAACFRNFG